MVDLQTVIDEINTGKIEFDYKDDNCCTTEGEVVILLKRLAELETADVVEVKHGRWITRKSIHNEEFYVCSVCGTANDDIWRYCPNCGAKMDGGDTE